MRPVAAFLAGPRLARARPAGARLKLGPVSPGGPDPAGGAPDLAPGEVLATKHGVFAGTGSRPVRLGEVQAPGKRRMMASDWARGLRSAGPVRLG